MDFYEEYKPFRNYMRRFDLVSSLVNIWCYSLHIIDDLPLPDNYAVDKNKHTLKPITEHIYAWDLDILVRELVLNAGNGGTRSLEKWNDLAIAINHIRRLDDIAYKPDDRAQVDIMFELHRIAHRQFPWQIEMGVAPMIRVFKVFGAATVEEIVVRELGMSTRQFLQLGAAIAGHFRNQWGLSTNQDYKVLGISREASDAFFRRLTSTLDQLKSETAKRQSYNHDWLYAWNPLESTPLVGIDPAFPDRVICPIPRYLLRRISAGIFYDLVKSVGFDNPFGNAFQAYVGDILKTTCQPPRFTILAEEPYYVGTQKMHGVDWILSDNTGHLFIESKTKRLTVNAKTLSDAVALDKDLIVMASAIVQHYRNIRDALADKTRWLPDGLPIYPLILTMEDWFIFSPRINEMLNKHICRMLKDLIIPESVLDEMPYTIASAHEIEIAGQIIAQVGISPLMSKKTTFEQRMWSLLPFINTSFKREMKNVSWRLFAEDWARLMPNLAEMTARETAAKN